MKQPKTQEKTSHPQVQQTDGSKGHTKKRTVPSEPSVQIGGSDNSKQGWEMKTLGEVCIMYQPKTISTKEMVDDGEYPVFGANGIIGKYDRYNHEEPQLLITCRGATCGSVNISEPKSWINGNAMVVKSKDNKIDLRFLEYLFRGGIDLSKSITGAAQPQITRQSLSPVEIGYPRSLPEQRRIVAILDEAFAAIAKAKAHAEQNLQNAKALFDSYLQGVFEKKGEGWKITTLGEVSKINYGFTEKASFDEVGPKFLRITDIQENGVDWDTVPYCKCSVKEFPKYKLETGDIVFARTGATTGKSYLINNPPNSVFASYLIRLRMNSLNEFIPEFISYFFQTKSYWMKINEGISGSAQGGFNATKLGELEFHFPKSKGAQQTIVRQLDALRAETQRLEAVYQQKIADLEELKKSILEKAFRGEL